VVFQREDFLSSLRVLFRVLEEEREKGTLYRKEGM
tara:strand:- start:614 stop:718 length:105 start_codon:yes stop_codon:yes gene_type:complete